MDRDLLDELAEFRSTVPDARLQPDPVVLRGMVVKLRGVRAESKAIGIPDDFLGTMIGGFIECFRELDGLPRDDPFWEATNRRPTHLKMPDFCRKLARDTPADRHVRLMQVSVQVLVSHSFDPPT